MFWNEKCGGLLLDRHELPLTRRFVVYYCSALYSEMIGARIADARSRLKSKGRRIGGAVPYGYDADPRTKQLIVNAREAEAVRWMFEVAASGMRPTAIAESANSRGWRTKIMVARQTEKRRGGNLWTARQVVATLSNQVYIGRLNNGATGLHEALVKPELFDAAAEQLRSRQTRPPGRKYEIQWALKGIVVCAACGRGMSPHTVRYRNIIYRYYRCRSTAGGRPPCGYQIAVFMLESSVQGALWRRGVKIEADEIRNHVEVVTYDARNASVRAKLKVADPMEAVDIKAAGECR
jgi:hypothetical protein